MVMLNTVISLVEVNQFFKTYNKMLSKLEFYIKIPSRFRQIGKKS